MRATATALFLVAASSVAAPAYADFAGPSTVIFPPQKLPLRFTHQKHLAKKIACDFCHETAATSHNSKDLLTPKEEVCETCHVIDRDRPRAGTDKKSCGYCHLGFTLTSPVQRIEIPNPNLHFDHAVHVEKGVGCTTCHQGLDRIDLATRAQLPQMPTCLSCHQGNSSARADAKSKKPASRCATCHITDGSQLVQRFASGTLVPSGVIFGDNHGPTFRRDHRLAARDNQQYCENCHKQDFCLSCHNGTVAPFDFHGNDYLDRHAVDARRNMPDCSKCHQAQSFCLSCHERSGVTDATSGRGQDWKPIGTRNFHPPGWADTQAAGDPNHHAWQAARNLRECSSCHRQELCLQCHASNSSAAGAQGRMWVDPHPPGWATSKRCSELAAKNGRMCLRCHAPTDSNLNCR